MAWDLVGYAALLAALAAGSAFMLRRREAGASDALLGRSMSGYRLVEVLARGGMGTVYRATPEGSGGGVDLACKVMSAERCRDPEFRVRFLREIAICQQLDHPGLVRLHRAGEDQGRIYLLLDLVQGETLRSRIRRPGAEPSEVLGLLEPLFAAVAYAHGKGVIHRDLKPENVMITRDGEVKVMDFGLARRRGQTRITGSGGVVGTPAYMAPEALTGAEPGPAQDQYALGVIAYELLAGQSPFPEREPGRVMQRKVSETPPSLASHRPVHPGLDAVVARMLARDPEVRFPSVAEAWVALRQAAASGR